MRSHSGVAAKMFSALARVGVSIRMISTSEICITCLIDVDKAEDALRAVHEEFGLGAAAV
jgi:aspartate kinase